jgi:anti-sigma factor RsiW
LTKPNPRPGNSVKSLVARSTNPISVVQPKYGIAVDSATGIVCTTTEDDFSVEFYDVRKHHISVFVFQEQSLRARMDENSLAPKQPPFNMETWSQGGLRYSVIGDAGAADIDSLARLFKAAS